MKRINDKTYNSQYNKKVPIGHQSDINQTSIGVINSGQNCHFSPILLILLIILADNSGRYLTDNSDQPKFS